MLRLLVILLFITSPAMGNNIVDKQEVVTTLFPVYDFAKQIGQDRVEVTLLLPPGVEAHTFEPRPADVVKLNHADVFIYTGQLMEPWVEELLKSKTNENLLVVDSSVGIELMEEDSGSGHEGYEKDPHVWLDLTNAQQMVNTIAQAFARKDIAHAAFYRNNADSYNAKLADLDRRFKQTLATAKHKTLVYGGHFAFGYFAKRYHLEYRSPYSGFSPNAEPSPKAIAELIKVLQRSDIKYIFYEELLDPKVARIIAQETGATLELLHGAHNVSKEELESGIDFLAIMESNLSKLKIGLECQ